MAANNATVKLSEQRQAGVFKCWRKYIGGRMFYLTADRSESERLAMALLAAWKQLDQAEKAWNEEAIDSAYRLAGVRRGTVQRQAVGTQRLYDAIRDYLTEYKGRVSASRYQRHCVAPAAYKAFQADTPLRLVDWHRLAGCVEHFRSRPVTSHGVPMAVATLQTTLKAVLAFYDWCDTSGRWESPRRFEKLFRINYTALNTPLERRREGNGADVFTVAELVKLWSVATERQRLYIALALNTGETSQGIASLRLGDFRRDGDTLTIDRRRSKTQVRGVYLLWPECAALVTSQVEQGDGESLAFRTMDGKPLVWFCENGIGRVDSVAKTWNNRLTKAGVRRLGFSYLRKTGASMIRELSGSLETAQTYLSHKGGSVAERHYLARSFERLATALKAMREHLRPMFANGEVHTGTAAAGQAA